MKNIYKIIIGVGLTLGSLGFLGKNYYDYAKNDKEITKKEALKDIGLGLTTIAGIAIYSSGILKNTKNLEGELN